MQSSTREFDAVLSFFLTEIEEKIFRMRALGRMSCQDTAAKLGLSLHVVSSFYCNAEEKIKAADAEEALRHAGEVSILRVPEFAHSSMRYILWSRGLRTLERIAEVGRIGVVHLGVTGKTLDTLDEVLPKFGLRFSDEEDANELNSLLDRKEAEFQGWWETTAQEILDLGGKEEEEILWLRRSIKRVIHGQTRR